MNFHRRILKWGIRRLLEIAYECSFDDIKRPKMVYSGWKNQDGIFCPRTRLSDTVFLHNKERIFLGDNVFVWHNTILDGTAGLTIEEGCQIGAHVGIFTHSSHISIRLLGSHYNDVLEAERPGFVTKPVRIGRYVFIASGATILPGVTIGDGAIIGAGAVVSTDIPAYGVVTGNPSEKAGDSRSLDKQILRRVSDSRVADWYKSWQRDI